MKDLIEKLEHAGVGSRELDALVSVALKLDCKPNLTDDLHSLRPIRKDDHCAPGTYWFVQRSGMSLRTSEPVTTSLDAALALAERLFPDWDWIIGRTNGGLTIHCQFGGKDYVFGNTPALALCAAVIRAQSEARV